MNRNQLLKQLRSTSFNILWPDALWNDLGFTESPIWINGKGYGYFACDEPVVFYKASRIPDTKWREIKRKVKDGSIKFKDILGTPLVKMSFCEDEEIFSCDVLEGLLNLPDTMGNYFYCSETDERPEFFSDEKDFLDFIQRDWADVQWDDLSTEALKKWIERIQYGKYNQGFSFIVEIG